ncbi:aldo/keto reductase [Thauera linaloolentis]|uniref:Aldo/keto reductase n=1 Tax=Thauera linaloolentis (strain DSM 12138 / JCM 21573 / CCUG 41526 / CIP 105981 / IAM 15112 / NBRC 102519 / 47Lol) TaxID=1123367 RepID=N6Y4J8_THAL4|nr:aldo/keto reductase [Thauera linaloolentis]ENO86515.1 aldo/keto reductase [Thauera linaloolentis 47Lol = DSM 12138]MCM8566498.1 aldo/keto reductase [Thauera linaloolentis]
MQRRKLGTDLDVSALGLGCMGMSEFYGPRDDELAMQALAQATEMGVDFLDTADIYGPQHNEELIGRFLATHRPQVRIATKFGIVRKAGEYRRSLDNTPQYARQCCEASLRRLGIEQIDLYYVHRVDPAHPIEETMAGLARLVQEGKIARIGLCEVSAATLRRAHAVHPVAALQTEYSLWTREVEAEVLPTCRELGIGLVAYSPLGRGFLTGRFQSDARFEEGDFRASLPRFQPGNIGTNRSLVEVVAALAAHKACSTAQIALAWLLAQGDDIVPIPGTRRIAHLQDNLGALSVHLQPDDLAELNRALDALPVVGERYTEEGMKGIDA